MRLIWLAALWLPSTAHATVRRIDLTPDTAQISYTAYALGLLPVTATFDRFRGTVEQDTGQPGNCQIDVSVDVASLHMNDPARRRRALAPDMLDSDRYPTMHFTGICAPKSIVGLLTLHGVTRELTLSMQRIGTQVDCSGLLARRNFGVDGMRGLVASNVRLRLTVHLQN